MKLYRRTAILLLLIACIALWDLAHRSKKVSAQGLQVALLHPCTNEEAFRELGDDRQIVVTSIDSTRVDINATPFVLTTVGPELEQIFAYRELKLVWFIGNRNGTYGQAIDVLAHLHTKQTHAVTVLVTRLQTAATDPADCPAFL